MEPAAVTLVVPQELRFFLPVRKRATELQVGADGTSTLGHLLAAAGVPKVTANKAKPRA